jgi:hypothetical protein
MAKPDRPALSEEMRLEVGGVKYRLRLADFSGEDDLAVYRAVGLSITDIFSGALSLFTVAALLWAHRRKREPDLTYEEVARGFRFTDMETIRSGNAPAPGKAGAAAAADDDVDKVDDAPPA